jgi:nitrogen fixation/metabolism regulation signal transduction histidine kinase
MQVIVENKHIVKIMSGNFKEKTSNKAFNKSEFFEKIIHDLPDSVIIIENDGIIKTANQVTGALMKLILKQ